MRYISLLAAWLLLLVASSCSEPQLVVIGDQTPATLSLPASAPLAFSAENIELPFPTLSWTRADFGFASANPIYSVQMALAGTQFQNPVGLGTTEATELKLSNAAINSKLITLGATPGVATAIEFRVVATLHEDIASSSNLVALSITPYEVVIEYAKLFVSSDTNGWGFNDKDALFSVADNGIYEGYLYLANGENWTGFKLSYQPDWNNAAAIVGDPTDAGTSGTLQVGNWGGKNIMATEGPGVYKITANIPALSYQLYKTDWAVTGDFNSWAFTAMAYDPATETFSLTADFTAGGFKFISNADWNRTLGDNEADGKLDKGTNDNNIRISEAGNYTIRLDLSGAIYTYSVRKN